MNDHDFMKPIKGLGMVDQFNCLLVYKKKRPAYLLAFCPSEKNKYNAKIIKYHDKKVSQVKKHYPFLHVSQAGNSCFVHKNKLPARQKDETLIHYTGRILGYSHPFDDMQTQFSWKYRTVVNYYLITEKDIYQIYPEVMQYKSDLINRLKGFQEVAAKIGYKVELEVRRELTDLRFPIENATNTKLDPERNKENYAILFNLALVFSNIRDAYYPMEWAEYITQKDIEEIFPKLFKFKPLGNSFIVHKRRLAPFPKNPEKEVKPGVTELDMYLGKVLEYSCPGEMIDRVRYSSINYYVNGVRFLSEICRNEKDLKDRTKWHQHVANKLGWKLKTEFKKNVPLKTGLVKRFSNEFEGELKTKMINILKGNIKEFEWNNKEDLKKIRAIKKFVKVKGNKVQVIS